MFKNWSFFILRNLYLKIDVTYFTLSFSFLQEVKHSKSTAQEGPVPANFFYGAVDPSTSLKVLKAVPTLKAAFAGGIPDSRSQQKQKEVSVKKTHGKLCTSHFGCKNIAVCRESSGTLFCKKHKPRQVPTSAICSEKQNAKKPSKK